MCVCVCVCVCVCEFVCVFSRSHNVLPRVLFKFSSLVNKTLPMNLSVRPSINHSVRPSCINRFCELSYVVTVTLCIGLK